MNDEVSAICDELLEIDSAGHVLIEALEVAVKKADEMSSRKSRQGTVRISDFDLFLRATAKFIADDEQREPLIARQYDAATMNNGERRNKARCKLAECHRAQIHSRQISSGECRKGNCFERSKMDGNSQVLAPQSCREQNKYTSKEDAVTPLPT